MKRFYTLLICVGLSAQLSANTLVHEKVLDNGMKILVKEDHRAPIVVSQVWYKVGSSYEPDGVTGVSHVLEHMMFKGTEKFAPGEFSRVIAANGGSENAFTGRDYTAYFQTLSSDRLKVSMEMESDRMRNLTLPNEEFLKELEVVKEERRMRTEDKPNAQLIEQFNSTAFRALPYANPVIGWMNDLDHMEVGDLATWYKKWYAPNNATLVVVGDVKPDEVFALAAQYFGGLAKSEIPVLKPLREAPQKGEIRLKVKVPARQPYLVMGYQTPSLHDVKDDTEVYALEMLAGILDGGNSARLSKTLIRGKQIAVMADADFSGFTRLSEMLTLDGIPAEGHSIADLENAFLQQVALLKTESVTQEEIDRVSAQIIASKVYELDSVFYQAMQLGLLETIGLDWRLAEQYADKIKQVTPEQVMAVAKKYLVEDHLTVAILEPLPLATGGDNNAK